MDKFRLQFGISLIATVFAMQAAPTAAQSYDAAAAPSTEDEIVVTAQRRSQSVQDVGISVAAYSGELLTQMGLDSSVEIARITPGVHLSGSAGGQNSQFSIRGVTQNEIIDTIEGPIAVYVDEGYIPNLQGQTFGLFDLERVEVLKGPQGTLFGRNATGGLVHFIIRKPTDSWDGYANLTYGRFDQVKAEAALGGPLGENIAFRLSGYFNRFDPIWKNVYPGSVAAGHPLGVGAPLSPCCEDVGNDNTLAGRAQLQFEPTEALTIRLVGSAARQHLSESPYTSLSTIAEVDSEGRVINAYYASPGETRVGIGPTGGNYTGFNGAPASRAPGANWFGTIAPDPDELELAKDFALSDINRTRSYNAALHLDYDLGGMSLAAITDYKKLTKYLTMDVDASPANLINVSFIADTRSLSQEFRLSGDSPLLNWVVGAYYLHIDSDARNGFLAPRRSFFAANLGFAEQGIDLINIFGLKTDSSSAFGQIEYRFGPKFTFVLGGRIIREKQKYRFASFAFANERDYYIDSGVQLFSLQPAFNDTRSTTLWAGKVQLEYRPNNDVLLYAGVNRGVKGGNYNAKLPDGSAPLAPGEVPYDPEVLLSYEVGLKSTLLDGAATFNAAAFYYDYSDYQAFTFSNVSGFVQNRDARTYGIEAELSVEPTEGLRLSGGLSLFDAKVKNVQIAPGLFRDVKPTFAPETQASARISYRLPVAVAGGSLTLGGDVSYSSSFYHNIRNFEANRLPGYTLFNANATWEDPSEHFRLTAFLENLTDKRYQVIGYDLSTLCGCSEAAYGRPQWWGITAAYSF